jgi:hypothetical protein
MFKFFKNLFSNKSKIARQHYDLGIEFETIKYDPDRRERCKEIEDQMKRNEERYPNLMFSEVYPYNESYMWLD